jgi:hypothetical protein
MAALSGRGSRSGRGLLPSSAQQALFQMFWLLRPHACLVSLMLTHISLSGCTSFRAY